MKLCLIAVVIYIAVAYGRIVPDYIPQCSRRDIDINKCILDAVETMRPRLKTGIPEIHLPGLDPFTMDELSVDERISIAKVKARFNDIKSSQASNFSIENLRVDLDTYSGTAKLVFRHIDVTADYDTEGSKALHIIPVHIKGKLRATLRNVEVLAKVAASPVWRNGEEYLNLDTVLTNVKIGDVDLDLNADNSNPNLEGIPSPSYYMPFLSPVTNKLAADLTKHYAKEVLAFVPLHDVLTD